MRIMLVCLWMCVKGEGLRSTDWPTRSLVRPLAPLPSPSLLAADSQHTEQDVALLEEDEDDEEEEDGLGANGLGGGGGGGGGGGRGVGSGKAGRRGGGAGGMMAPGTDDEDFQVRGWLLLLLGGR